MTKVSVIVPVYGVEKYLKEALNSVLSQSLKDIEIILIDDGSKDNCPEIIDEYSKKDNRIIPIHKENSGYGATVNLGIERAQGEYIAILEPDDYIDFHMYEDLYKIAKEFDSDIVKSSYFDNLQSKEETRILPVIFDKKIPENKSFNIKECGLFLQYHPSIWSAIYKKEFLNKNNIRFLEIEGSNWTDNLFQVQTMCLAEKINFINKPYYFWRRINKNGSNDIKDYKMPIQRCIEIHNWLDENKIQDEEILSNLYSREISYMKMILEMDEIENIKECMLLINNLCKRLNKDIIFNSNNIKKSRKKIFKQLLKNPYKLRQFLLFKKVQQNLFSVRWNKKEKRVILFGRTILKGNI